MSETWRRSGVLFGVALIIVVLDQVTKRLVVQTMHLHDSIPVIPGLFNLTYIRNPGAAFGLFASTHSAFRFMFFVGASIVALGVLWTMFYRMKPDDRWGQLTIAGIVGGAVGNLIDRLRYGEVVDFLDVHMGGWHWPAFNVADSAISVGVVSLLILFALEKKPDGASSTSAPRDPVP